MIYISDTIQLKPITLKEHSKLMLLMQHVYPPAYKHLWKHENTDWYIEYSFNKDNLQKELKVNGSEYYFILYNLKEVGIIRIVHNKPLNELPKKSATYIHRIYLSQEIQGKGVGKQLFEWSYKQAIINQSDIMWLKAMDTQTQALRFYEKQGFKTINNISLDFDLIHKPLRGMVIMYKTL